MPPRSLCPRRTGLRLLPHACWLCGMYFALPGPSRARMPCRPHPVASACPPSVCVCPTPVAHARHPGCAADMQPGRSLKRRGFSTPFAGRAAANGGATPSAATATAEDVGAGIDLDDGAAAPAPLTARAPRPRALQRPHMPARRPLHTRPVDGAGQGDAAKTDTPPAGDAGAAVEYEVMYAVNSSKKHKNWNGGVMRCTASRLHLQDEDTAKEIASCFKKLKEWEGGEEAVCGKYIVEVVARRAEVGGASGGAAAPVRAAPVPEPPAKRVKRTFSTPLQAARGGGAGRGTPTAASPCAVSPDCLVLQETAAGEPTAFLERALSVELRQHQREGVRHLFQTTNKPAGFAGVILADEMGLGKTLQCISLIQAHLQNKSSKVKKVLIVVPSSLVKNWAREFTKWLKHNYRSQPTILSPGEKKDYTMSKIRCFQVSRMVPVMILSYEMCRNYGDVMKGVPCDLLVCDEGHRLKGMGTQILRVLQQFTTPRKVLITGTPVQNNLAEYYSLFEFINPGLLGDRAAFNRAYLHPIARMGDPDAPRTARADGDAAQAALTKLTAPYMLRRTHSSISTGLPPKTEVILFFRPSRLQEALYEGVLENVGGRLDALQAITLLKKILISPALVSAEAAVDDKSDRGVPAVCRALLPMLRGRTPTDGGGGKMELLLRLLEQFREQGHKCVVVSSSVRALVCIEGEIGARGFGSIRFDGSVSGAKRMDLVDRFNSPTSGVHVMLLSCKAGGVGLNLIGASRLVLADMDWNPANDLQAIARIWREGQKKACRIYRLVCRGTLEERVLQRQLVKMSLSQTTLRMMDAAPMPKRGPAQWSQEDLRRLFEYDWARPCMTFRDARAIEEQLADVLGEDPALAGSSVTFVKCLTADDAAAATAEVDGDASDDTSSSSCGESLPDVDAEGDGASSDVQPVDGAPRATMLQPAAAVEEEEEIADLIGIDDETWLV